MFWFIFGSGSLIGGAKLSKVWREGGGLYNDDDDGWNASAFGLNGGIGRSNNGVAPLDVAGISNRTTGGGFGHEAAVVALEGMFKAGIETDIGCGM